jgi:hypothetical protein
MKRLWIGLAALLLAAVPAFASTVIGMSVEDHARLSQHVVLGTIVSQVGIDDPEMGIETAVTIKVRHDFKRQAAAGDLVTFHIRSGEFDGVISTAVGEAVFQTGKMAVVFLEDIDGKLYNIGLSSGVWNVLEDKRGGMSFTRALQDGLEVVGGTFEMGPVSFQGMAARIATAARKPEFDNPMLREARLED